MAEKKQVNIRVPASKKDEWDNYAEEHYGSLTRLVSTAVEKEVSGASGGSGDSGGEAHGEALTQALEAIDRLENTVSSMDKRLSAVKETVDSSGPDISLKAAVRETLPTVPDSALAPGGESGEGSYIAGPEEGGPDPDDWAMTATQVAARLNADESAVRQATEELATESPEVESLRDGEQTFYHRGDN